MSGPGDILHIHVKNLGVISAGNVQFHPLHVYHKHLSIAEKSS